MKNLVLIMLVVFFSLETSAQTWKKNIYGTSGNKGVRTIRLTPASNVTVRTLEINNDSINYSTTFTGRFESATDDSLTIRLDNFSDLKILGSGLRYSSMIPGSMYVQPFSGQKGMATLSLTDIDFMSYRNSHAVKAGNIGEGMIFASLFVLLISPAICIDYREGSFDAERYKYWALGSTAVLFCSFTVEALFTGQKRFQFTADWPMKKQKEWSFIRENK